jgi:hypothetical protein
MIREYRMQLDFLVCAYVLIFVCFLVTLWRREREDGQTIAGKLVKVALEVALKMWYKGVCVVVRAVACIFKRCVYDAFLVGIWNHLSDSVCVGGEYVVGILENMISTALICVYVVYLGVCTGANILFWFIFNRVGVIILSLIVLVREMMRGVFYYAPTFAFSTLLIICLIDFTEVGVDSVLGIAIPGHKASDLTGKKDSLHALVLERESSEKSFPYLLSAQKLGRAVLVKNGVGVGELGPKTWRYGVFQKIAFVFVHRHP